MCAIDGQAMCGRTRWARMFALTQSNALFGTLSKLRPTPKIATFSPRPRSDVDATRYPSAPVHARLPRAHEPARRMRTSATASDERASACLSPVPRVPRTSMRARRRTARPSLSLHPIVLHSVRSCLSPPVRSCLPLARPDRTLCRVCIARVPVGCQIRCLHAWCRHIVLLP